MSGFAFSMGQIAERRGGASGLPVPSALLMSNRLNQPGFSGYTVSNGSDLDGNTRLALYNQTGASVTKLKAYWVNWYADSTNEHAALNAITLTAALEYPAGTFQAFTFAAASSATLAIDALQASDEMTLTAAIPDGAQYWIRTFVSVSSGNVWPQGYQMNTTRGEAADFATGVDKTLSGTISNATPATGRRGYGPIGVKATAFAGTPKKRAFASFGDSVLMQAGDGNYDSIGSGGWNGRSLSGRYPHANFAISGTTAQSNQPASYTRRLAAMSAIGITDVLCDFHHNDLGAGRSVAQIQADILAIATDLTAHGFRVHYTTSLPRTTGTWKTAAGQTAYATNGGFAGDTSSRRHLLNVWLRSLPSPIVGLVEISNAVDVDSNNAFSAGGGYWLSGNGGAGAASAHLTTSAAASDAATIDGIHPDVTNTASPFYGGHYILKDAFDAYLDGLVD